MVNNKNFSMNLICLPFSHLDVVLGMDWLLSNHVILNCKNKTLIFGACAQNILGSSSLEISHASEAKRVENVKAFMVLSNTKESLNIGGMPIVCKFPKVFLRDVIELPPERALEFAINLVLGSSLVSIAPYWMSLMELAEVKKQVEGFLNKQLVRPSVSSWGAPTLLVKKKDKSMRMCADYQ
ncbi:uncharacterized protein LOC114410653 [Glycine soja]|uniref:uncharacterized protein n=1 Tax=Glycine max TaxID=3847 RepID=UPI0003DEB411|nr:uncharacterized protein LOC102659623 [Glycine max]XP_028230408.1 uncharacterized protein LOC114410653 [Glycine soja]|eukprot:XP_006579176.1 uncharacterized protein LOC102659623 [Glycine max]